jgi:putative Holliday junction resolvase
MPGTPEAPRETGVVLAFDFGRRRVGLATANLYTRTASPLTTLDVANELPWAELDRIVSQWRPDRFVVGTPGAGEGSDVSELGRRIEAFCAELTGRYGLPVATVDEAFTSRAARAELTQGRRSGFLRRRIRRERIDSHAACLIAEQWLSDAAEARV